MQLDATYSVAESIILGGALWWRSYAKSNSFVVPPTQHNLLSLSLEPEIERFENKKINRFFKKPSIIKIERVRLIGKKMRL